MRGSEPGVVYSTGDKIRAHTIDGMKVGVVKTLSGRGCWVVFENNGDLETFIKSENVIEVVEGRGARQTEVVEMGENKKVVKKKVVKARPEAVKPEAKKLKEPYAPQDSCEHDIVERKVKADGKFEPKGRCFDCGKVLDFTEAGEKKNTPP
jgi:hypothetical protein